jgi:hypothetical protein
VTLIDTGPLVALIDKGDKETHEKCVSIVKKLSGSLTTTLPCLTEALHFLRGLRGWKGQDGLWQYVKNGELLVHLPLQSELIRASELMEQYQDTPMAIADASLVALAELSGVHQIITSDSDFYHYRINGKDSFEVILLSAT